MRWLLALASALLLASPLPAGADEILLRNGGRLIGIVMERHADRLVVEVEDGEITLPASHVERIVAGPTSLSLYREKAAQLAPEDVKGWLDLGVWARERKLTNQARQAFEHVRELESDNAVANHALGYVQLGERWVTPEESYRARGYVLFEGRWMLPEQREEAIRDHDRQLREREVAAREREAAAREQEARAALAQAEQARVAAEERAREAEARAAEAEARSRARRSAFFGGDGFGAGYAGFGAPFGTDGPIYTVCHFKGQPFLCASPYGYPGFGLFPGFGFGVPRTFPCCGGTHPGGFCPKRRSRHQSQRVVLVR